MVRPRTFGNCAIDGTLGGVGVKSEEPLPPAPHAERARLSESISTSHTSRMNPKMYAVERRARVRDHTALTSRCMRLPFQQQVESKLYTFYALTRAGFVRPERPDTLARLIQILVRWGATPAAAAAASAARYATETAIEDELGNLSFRE